ncbi:unnamed protein product [Pieris macdunnoughi]|uniref:Uncharacterized protein n=2 Tax=Pieris macdunnoughi TaxID=345717 RepID=A0A821UZG1_9NEOP|nr:unnamed protein product [Pieris macdunnoughi]
MQSSLKLQLLTCLALYACSVQAIMVKFGTKGGPIEPPTPEPPTASPRVFHAPAPVWEERTNDAPDPNAHWRPFIPKQTYTQVLFNAPTTQQPINNAQRFVNLYAPSQPKTNEYNPSQVLSSQALPGFGLRYFVPTYDWQKKDYRQEDARNNQVETNHVENSRDSSSDLLWKYEKDAVRRTLRNTLESTVPVFQWQWPAYVQPRH